MVMIIFTNYDTKKKEIVITNDAVHIYEESPYKDKNYTCISVNGTIHNALETPETLLGQMIKI